jgi:hypothetical protein
MMMAETEWYLITVDNKHGIKLMKELDEWLEQPMIDRNTYLFNEIKDGVVCFKVLLPLFAVNSIARDMVLGKDKEALTNLYHTMAGWFLMAQHHTMTWLATTPRERREQLKLFMQYVDKICASDREDKHYFSSVEHRFFGRIKKYEDEAYEEWGMIV